MSVTRRRSDLGRIAAGTALLVVVSFPVRKGRVGAAEERIFRQINELPTVHPGVLWSQQQFGNVAIGPAVAIVAGVRRDWHLAGAAAMATALKLVLERVVKAVIIRERPAITVSEPVLRGNVPVAGQSFVSGHATMVTALATAVGPHLPRRWRFVPWAAAATVCVARVYSGAHNPLDVVGGAGLGIAIGGLTNVVLGVPDVEAAPATA
jgi:undecaprenyl-diphosphatase